MPRTWSSVLARTGVPTGDQRILAPDGGSSRSLPLPIAYQAESGDGHGGSVVVGRIETLRIESGMVTATGSLLDSAPWEMIEQIEAGVIGPSVDLDDIEYVMDENEILVLTKWRVSGATLVAIPAFADVHLTLDPLPAEAVTERSPELEAAEAAWARDVMDVYDSLRSSGGSGGIHAYVRSEHSNAGNCECGMALESAVHPHAYAAAQVPPGCICARSEDDPIHGGSLAASAGGNGGSNPALPPLDWFRSPDLDRLTPLTISDTGRVFGHIAPWDQCHVGLPGCVTAPSSVSGYSYFHQGEQRTQEGVVLPVGTLVAGPRHADAQLAFHAATAHYDDVDAAVAKVIAGEDEFGIWVAGWMLPTARPEAVEIFRNSPISGDWRRVGGALELIAVCSVNSAGFPVPRARVAFSAGHQRSLIGSFGVTPVSGPDRVATVEAVEVVIGADEARAKWAWATAEKG